MPPFACTRTRLLQTAVRPPPVPNPDPGLPIPIKSATALVQCPCPVSSSCVAERDQPSYATRPGLSNKYPGGDALGVPTTPLTPVFVHPHPRGSTVTSLTSHLVLHLPLTSNT